MQNRLYGLSHLQELKELTFDNFEPRGRFGLSPQQADTLELAFNKSRQLAQSHDGWLLLQGKNGCGKTHLAAAIANFAVEVGVPTLFITVPDLLDSLRFAYQDPEETFEERFEKIRRSNLLVLDDFGTQNATAWAQEKLFQILNYRYVNRLPTVVTTNLSLNQIEDRIQSRLRDPELVTHITILAPDHRDPTGDSGTGAAKPLLNRLRKHSFSNFSTREDESGLSDRDLESLSKAFHAAHKFAEKPQGWLLFSGPHGCGKTHLAAAIANQRDGLGFSPFFISTPDLMDFIRETFNPDSPVSYSERFDEIRTTSLLILDDLGALSKSAWVREKLYQILNYRYDDELPTVMTTAHTVKELDPRIQSRLLDARLCKVYPITVPSFRGMTDKPFKVVKKGKRKRRS